MMLRYRFQVSVGAVLRTGLLVLAVLLCGCVKRWTKPDGSWEQFERDRAHCEKVASLRSGLLQDEGRFDRCMEARGYQRK